MIGGHGGGVRLIRNSDRSMRRSKESVFQDVNRLSKYAVQG